MTLTVSVTKNNFLYYGIDVDVMVFNFMIIFVSEAEQWNVPIFEPTHYW